MVGLGSRLATIIITIIQIKLKKINCNSFNWFQFVQRFCVLFNFYIFLFRVTDKNIYLFEINWSVFKNLTYTVLRVFVYNNHITVGSKFKHTQPSLDHRWLFWAFNHYNRQMSLRRDGKTSPRVGQVTDCRFRSYEFTQTRAVPLASNPLTHILIKKFEFQRKNT